MKKILTIAFVLVAFFAKAQYTPQNAYGYKFKRVMADSTLHIPNFCGVPTLQDTTTKKAAIAFDSCNNRLYFYNPQTFTWGYLSGGGVDSATIYQYINNIYNYLTNDTAYLNQFQPAGVYVTSAQIIQDSILRVCYRSLTVSDSCIDDTLTNSNISFITNLITQILGDTALQDTTFIDAQNVDGNPIASSSTDPVTNNDTLHVRIPATGQAGKFLSNDGTNLTWSTGGGGSILDTTFQWSVLDSLSTPSGGAVTGDIYLVGTSPTGAFATHANEIATFGGVSYTFQTASVGDLLYNAATDFVSKWTGTVWRRVGKATIHQGGDRYATTIVIGSSDNRQVNLKTNNTPRITISNGGNTTFTKLTGVGDALMGLSSTGLTSRVATGSGLLLSGGTLSSTGGGIQPSDTAAMLSPYLKKLNITAGTNVTLTGSGTDVSPYVVSSTGGGGSANDSAYVNISTPPADTSLVFTRDNNNQDTVQYVVRNNNQLNNISYTGGQPVTILGGAAMFNRSKRHSLFTPSNQSVMIDTSGRGLTISGWVYLYQNDSAQAIAAKDDNLTLAGTEYLLCHYPAPHNRFLWQVETNTTTRIVTSSIASPAAINTWYYIEGRYDQANTKIYIRVNNVLDSLDFAETTFHNVPSTPFTLGSNSNFYSATTNSWLNGELKNVRFFKRPLTTAESDILYNGGTPLPYTSIPNSLLNDPYFISSWDFLDRDNVGADSR